jgi:hypothetical protein
MKLIFCPECHDVVRLLEFQRECRCRASWGCYRPDGENIVVGGKGVPMAIAGGSITRALRLLKEYPDSETGPDLDAWFFSPKFHKVTRV